MAIDVNNSARYCKIWVTYRRPGNFTKELSRYVGIVWEKITPTQRLYETIWSRSKAIGKLPSFEN